MTSEAIAEHCFFFSISGDRLLGTINLFVQCTCIEHSPQLIRDVFLFQGSYTFIIWKIQGFPGRFLHFFPGVFQGYLIYKPISLRSWQFFWVYNAVNDFKWHFDNMKKCCDNIRYSTKNFYSIFFLIVLHGLGMILHPAQFLSFPGFSRNKLWIPGFSRVFQD